MVAMTHYWNVRKKSEIQWNSRLQFTMRKNEQINEDSSNNKNRNEPFAWEFDVKSLYVLRFNSFNCCFFFSSFVSSHLQKVTLLLVCFDFISTSFFHPTFRYCCWLFNWLKKVTFFSSLFLFFFIYYFP